MGRVGLMTDRRTKRILIVENECLVALHLEDVLTGMGHQVVGSCTRIEAAIAVARERNIDFAILDVNVAGRPSFPVADILRQRGIPFVFASGYGLEGLVDGYRNETALRKPYDLEELRQAITRIFQELSH